MMIRRLFSINSIAHPEMSQATSVCYDLDLLDFDLVNIADDGQPVTQALAVAEVEDRMESLQYQLNKALEVSICSSVY
jgi:hypothetical protein